jgi:hypothetical protein
MAMPEEGKSMGARSLGGVSAWGLGGVLVQRFSGVVVRMCGMAVTPHGAPTSTPDAGWRHGREKGERPWRCTVRWEGGGEEPKGHGGSTVGVWVAWGIGAAAWALWGR